MAFIATPDSVRALIETWEGIVGWLEDHPKFFGCSGILAWVVILGFIIRWLIQHVRFV